MYLKNTSNDIIDKQKCNDEYKQFLDNQEKEITRIKNAGIRNKNFGF